MPTHHTFKTAILDKPHSTSVRRILSDEGVQEIEIKTLKEPYPKQCLNLGQMA
jgi:hypothetical protein